MSSDKGIVFVTDLTPGKYQFIETKAPTGYVINSTPTDFIISESAQGEPIAVEAKLVNYKGSAQLVKTDSNGKPLAGAAFKVVDADGKTVLDKLVSSDKGIVSVSDLAPGKYQFIETKAPKGYYLNSNPVDFTIDKEAAGEPGLVRAGNLVNMEIKNDTPEWPSNPETPSAPDEPDSPDNPEKPCIPTDPGKPSIPDNPTTAKTVYDKRYNKKTRHDTSQKLPKTNYQNTLWLTILGLVILMLVVLVIYRNKKADQAE